MALKQFRSTPILKMNGTPYAEVSTNRILVHIGVDSEEFESFTVSEAREIRDWLNLVLLDEDKSAYRCSPASGGAES